MVLIQALQESLSVFHLLPFLYFELVSKLLKKDDDRGSGINVLAYQA